MLRVCVVGALVALLLAGTGTGPVDADGAVLDFTLDPGCWGIERTIVGLDDDGAGTMTVDPFEGVVEFAILTWAGSDDLTPQTVVGGDRADSTLTINGAEVVGQQLAGDLGYAPFPENEWFVWEADITNLLDPAGTTLEISGWDANWTTPDPALRDHTNGAILSIVTDKVPCAEPVSVDLYRGLDYVHHGVNLADSSDDYTEAIVFPMTDMVIEQRVEIPIFFAGTEFGVDCRGLDLWGASGNASNFPTNATGGPNYNAAYDIFANQNNGARLINNVAVNQLGNCPPGWSANLNGVRVTDVRVIGAADDVSAVVADVILPANHDWLALQMESVAADNGESGAWVLSAVVNRARPDALGDTVWIDTNRNCVQDPGEPPLEGATVRLTPDPSRSISPAPQTTNAKGRYGFFDLPIGTHQVTFELPDGYAFTEPNCGSDDLIDSDAIPSAANARISEPIDGVLDGVKGDVTIDAGVVVELAEGRGSIGDYVWLDDNGDGCQDTSERGVSGVAVTLRQAGAVIATTTTDASGGYLFDGLPDGEYQVGFNAPTGTEPTRGSCASSDSDSNGPNSSVVLAGGVSDLSVDLGLEEVDVPETLAFTGLDSGDMVWLAFMICLAGALLSAAFTKRAWNH